MTKPVKLAVGIGSAGLVCAGLGWLAPAPWSWLGYWTAELEGRAQPEILYLQPLESEEADPAISTEAGTCATSRDQASAA